MQISASLPAPLQNPAISTQNGQSQNPAATGELASGIAKPAAIAEQPATDAITIDLSPASTQNRRLNDQATAVFAEIWKDGRKVAEVDMHGGVTSLDGALAPISGASASIPEQAARRAAQVALTIGGEIRSGGVTTDLRTLVTTARLRRAYAS